MTTCSQKESAKIRMPSKERTINIPCGGWKEQTYYAVWVAWNKSNPIHKAVLYSGFINESTMEPDVGSRIWNTTYTNSSAQLRDLHFLEVIEEINSLNEV